MSQAKTPHFGTKAITFKQRKSSNYDAARTHTNHRGHGSILCLPVKGSLLLIKAVLLVVGTQELNELAHLLRDRGVKAQRLVSYRMLKLDVAGV